MTNVKEDTTTRMGNYIARNVNKLSYQDKVHVVKMLLFREQPLQQSNNGCFIYLREIDENIKKEIFNFIKLKLNS